MWCVWHCVGEAVVRVKFAWLYCVAGGLLCFVFRGVLESSRSAEIHHPRGLFLTCCCVMSVCELETVAW